MALSEKKDATNKAHMAKLEPILIRPYKQEAAKIRKAAADAGQSLQGYILQAVRERMQRDASGGQGGASE